MFSLVFLTALTTFSLASCAPNHSPPYVHPTSGNCIDLPLRETVTSSNYVFGLPKFKSNFDVVGLLFDIATSAVSSTPFVPFSGLENVTATYEASATFCSPKTMKGKESTVLVATHGLGYDRRYWAPGYKEDEYSFAEYALKQGYSVLYYDRLGTGKSQILSGYVNQLSIQTELLAKIVKSVRAGKYTGKIQAEKIILVGHSFGSSISNELVATYPDLVEGAVLTGIGYDSGNSSTIAVPYIPSIFSNRIASMQSSAFKHLDTGYLGFGDIYSHVETFFHKPDYAEDVAKYAQDIAQPLAIAEFLSLNTVQPVAPEFKGKVLVTTGEFDIIICSGNCVKTFASRYYKEIFPMADAEGYVHLGAGHGVNFNYNATGFYKVIGNFLDGF
ncbi:alpha/beta-hydrolase [Lojkania enalia]|uniref:Alpha/beta-hydrolase n=1 Tax=Lojkania enalia TaxID=147567 RepID=A0A9P4MXY6_9PLEO|nr:alpha/beta-hydrolase [Didymosphaeria enalia]